MLLLCFGMLLLRYSVHRVVTQEDKSHTMLERYCKNVISTQLLPWYGVAQVLCTRSSETVKVRQTQGFNDPALMLLLFSFYLGMLMLR